MANKSKLRPPVTPNAEMQRIVQSVYDDLNKIISDEIPETTPAASTSSSSSYTETDPIFSAWDRSTGITITESQISDLQNYALAGHTHSYDNYQYWELREDGDVSGHQVTPTSAVTFIGGTGIEVSRTTSNITIESTVVNTDTNYYLTGLAFSGGTLTATVTGAPSNPSVSLDGRYSLIGHTHSYDNYQSWELLVNATAGSGLDITSGASLEFAGGTGINVTLTGSVVSIASTVTDTNFYLTGLSFSGGILTATVNGASNPTVNLDGRYSLTSHTHSHFTDTANPHSVTTGQIGAEPAFVKNTGFNKNFGTAAGTVSEGNHTHSATDITSGTLPITRGGTGGTSAAGARTNLGLTGDSNTTHYHDSRYYTETEINTFFSGVGAPSGYNKANWDSAFTHVSNTSNPHSVTASQVGAVPSTGGTFSGNVIWSSGYIYSRAMRSQQSAPYTNWDWRLLETNTRHIIHKYLRDEVDTGYYPYYENWYGGSSYVKIGVSNTNLQIEGNDVWHAGNLTSNSQLSNGAGYYSSGSTPTFGNTLITGNLTVPNIIYHRDDTDTYMQFHALDQWRVVTGGGERFEVTNTAINSAEPINAPNFILSSDRRLKSDIKALTGTEFRLLQPKSFYKDEQYGFGFIADEVQKFFPELIVQRSDKYLGLKQDNIIALNTAGLINVDNEVTRLKKRVKQLEEKVKALGGEA